MPVTIQPATLKYKNSQGVFQIADCIKGDRGLQGLKGDPGDPTELLDDTAGDGTTDKTWSANKISSEIGSKYTKPVTGIPGSDLANGVIPDISGKLNSSEKGAANGVAELDSNGKVPSSQLPSYVDDVLEYASQSAFPVTGESGKIYVALDTSKAYRWGGSAYVEISASLALGETESTAYRGDHGAEAYAAAVTNVDSTPTSESSHLVTSGGVYTALDTKAPKDNPVFTGSISMGRKANTTVGSKSTALGYDVTASGDYSHADGEDTIASGDYSHAEGYYSVASGAASHAEGYDTIASNSDAHAEGAGTLASGGDSHAEGNNTTASGHQSHAEGYYSLASGTASHAEGYYTIANGYAESVSGKYNKADTADAWVASTSYSVGNLVSVEESYVDGGGTTRTSTVIYRCKTANSDSTFTPSKWELSGQYLFVVGNGTSSSRSNAFSVGWDGNVAEGSGTTASGTASHAEGTSATASGEASHAEGGGTTASGSYSHAEGGGTRASASYSHAEGGGTRATNGQSHAEGAGTLASGMGAHAEGGYTTASGEASHAEGGGTTASGSSSHAEGGGTIASGSSSHAEGSITAASGVNSHAEGNQTVASGITSHSEGNYTVAAGADSHVGGRLNTVDSYDNWTEWTANTAYVVGDKCKVTTTSNDVTTITGYICNTAHTSGSSFEASNWTNQYGKMNYAEIIGNGTSIDARSNARALDWDGNERLMGNVYVGCNPDSTGGTQLTPPVGMTGATSSAAGAAGYVPAPAAGDEEKFLRGDGTWVTGGKPMVILSYGNSTWQDFINAYNNNVIVYCRASSNSNPASGSQTRMAFMAYVNDASNPTNVEFQYYRSVTSHSASQQGDQVFVYKLESSSGWTVTTREASSKVVAGTNMSSSYSSGTITLSADLSSCIATTEKGAANGVAELDANGKVPSSQLPSYVDDVIEGYYYNSKFYEEDTHTTEITAEADKIYIDIPTNKTYRWSGSAYVAIGSDLALGETSSTAYRGDRGAAAYAAAVTNVESSPSSGSSNLVTSGGVYTALDDKASKANPVFTGSISMGRKAGTTIGENSVAEGYDVTASGADSHAEGTSTTSSGTCSHTEGYSTTASGQFSHAEGTGGTYTSSGTTYTSAAAGTADHAEGYQCLTAANQPGNHAEGYQTRATGGAAHSEGNQTVASGTHAHAEGCYTIASNQQTHAEGVGSTASGAESHAEGAYTIAAGRSSHVQGAYNVADSYANWDEWVANTSYVVGDKVKRTNGQTVTAYICKTANSDSSFNSSKWTNQSGRMNYAEIVGNGTADNARSNARTLDWDGNERLMGQIYVGCNADSTGGTQLTPPVAMTGATSNAAGTAGYVPAPAAGDNTKFLRGDGTWAEGSGGGLETLIISTSITNASGQYTNTISDSRITSDMIAYDIAYGTPSVIKDDVEVECDNGEITISCDNAVGTTTVTLYIMGCTSLTVAEGVSY